MKKIPLFLLGIIVMLSVNSCETGYSKSSCISALEKFVNKVDENWKTYDDEAWVKADARMEAFEKKLEKYEEKLTKEESKKVSKLRTKYKTLRWKGGANTLFEDLTGMYEEGKGVVQGVMEGLQDMGETLGEYVDTLNSILK